MITCPDKHRILRLFKVRPTALPNSYHTLPRLHHSSTAARIASDSSRYRARRIIYLSDHSSGQAYLALRRLRLQPLQPGREDTRQGPSEEPHLPARLLDPCCIALYLVPEGHGSS
jgi:hypothetical protein